MISTQRTKDCQMGGLLKMYGIRRVFVIGAGFGAPLGMPLARDLLKDVYAVARTRRWQDENGPTPNGQADWLIEQINWYFPLDGIDHASASSGKLPEDFDIEKFLSYAAATSAFCQSTSGQFSNNDDKFIAFLKTWIAEAIVKREWNALAQKNDTYNHFIRSLQKSFVLTFNWDTLIERLLEANDMKCTFDLASTFENDRVPLLKLHGSVDWFSMPDQFLKKDWMSFEPIGGSFEDCYRAKGNPLAYYNQYLIPWIIIPSYDKISQVSALGRFWQTPWIWLHDDLEIIIIGFSMRPDDFHSRAFLYPQLVSGSRNGSLRVKVVDLAQTNEEQKKIRERFAGVENCQFFFDGFCERALEFIGVS